MGVPFFPSLPPSIQKHSKNESNSHKTVYIHPQTTFRNTFFSVVTSSAFRPDARSCYPFTAEDHQVIVET